MENLITYLGTVTCKFNPNQIGFIKHIYINQEYCVLDYSIKPNKYNTSTVFFSPLCTSTSMQFGFRFCICDDSECKIYRLHILIQDQLSPIFNSRQQPFSIQAVVGPKIIFYKYGQIIHCWKGNFTQVNIQNQYTEEGFKMTW